MNMHSFPEHEAVAELRAHAFRKVGWAASSVGSSVVATVLGKRVRGEGQQQANVQEIDD